MPIYEYVCKKCGHQMEVWQKFSDAPLTKCECCHGKLRKIISQNTFHLKGTGWYVTDYSSKSCSTNAKKLDTPVAEAKKAEPPSQNKDQSTGSSSKTDS